MRASTMFALIVAVLVGLGAAVAAKASGIFNRTEAKKEPPPIMVLAAANNIFEGSMIQPVDVRVRPATMQEVELLRRGELLPPMVQAATKRFAKLSIPADAPLRKDYLEDLAAEFDVRGVFVPAREVVARAGGRSGIVRRREPRTACGRSEQNLHQVMDIDHRKRRRTKAHNRMHSNARDRLKDRQAFRIAFAEDNAGADDGRRYVTRPFLGGGLAGAFAAAVV